MKRTLSTFVLAFASLLLARGARGTRVPDVRGLTPPEADQRLVAAHLTLGNVAPELDDKGEIASQVPVPGDQTSKS